MNLKRCIVIVMKSIANAFFERFSRFHLFSNLVNFSCTAVFPEQTYHIFGVVNNLIETVVVYLQTAFRRFAYLFFFPNHSMAEGKAHNEFFKTFFKFIE